MQRITMFSRKSAVGLLPPHPSGIPRQHAAQLTTTRSFVKILQLKERWMFTRQASNAPPSLVPQAMPALIAEQQHQQQQEERRRAATAKVISEQFDRNPILMQRVLERLSEDSRRHMLVAAAATEWYGSSEGHVHKADHDQDKKISAADYVRWVTQQIASKEKIPMWYLCLWGFQAAAPFVAFGFLDNSVMILSGGVIDHTVGQSLGLSVMGAAAMGGIISGTVGIQVHGVAERVVHWVLFAKLRLSEVPAKWLYHPSVFRATHVGGTLGIMVGLSLGMLPLLLAAE